MYTEELWEAFYGKILKHKKPKTYRHFDDVFDFEKSSNKIKDLVSDPTLKSVATFSFAPLVKILTKTPRYRYDESQGINDLETKIRPISFASHFDSYIYSFYSYALTEQYQIYIKENKFDDCILAYRSDLNGDCNIQFAKKAFSSVNDFVKSYGKCTAIALDIKGYFDNIDHTILKEKWCKVLGQDELPIDQYKIFRSQTNYSYVNKVTLLRHFNIRIGKFDRKKNLLDLIPEDINGNSYLQKFDLLRKRDLVVRNKPKNDKDDTASLKGIPQGSPLSSVLSNIYLIDFDRWLNNLGLVMGFKYYRYCDDLLIICQSKDASYLLEEIVDGIKNTYQLTIQGKKSEIIEFRANSKRELRAFNVKYPSPRKTTASNEQKFYKNLQYLGFEFNGKSIYVRSSSLSRYFRKAKGRVLKTMMMAYGQKSKSNKIYRKQLYEKYSHFGKRNFITYVQNAAKTEYTNAEGIVRQGLDSKAILRQLSSHFGFLQKEMTKSSSQFAKSKNISPKQ